MIYSTYRYPQPVPLDGFFDKISAAIKSGASKITQAIGADTRPLFERAPDIANKAVTSIKAGITIATNPGDPNAYANAYQSIIAPVTSKPSPSIEEIQTSPSPAEQQQTNSLPLATESDRSNLENGLLIGGGLLIAGSLIYLIFFPDNNKTVQAKSGRKPKFKTESLDLAK